MMENSQSTLCLPVCSICSKQLHFRYMDEYTSSSAQYCLPQSCEALTEAVNFGETMTMWNV